MMDEKMRQDVALHRWAVIAEAANPRLGAGERGSVVRAITGSPPRPASGTAPWSWSSTKRTCSIPPSWKSSG